MSISIHEMKSLKNEIEKENETGSTSVRIRSDVYKLAQEMARKRKISLSKYVTLSTLEKAIKDSETD
ncbi:hypothetical protein [Vibrio splendidus]|uniref:Uncharacterized protein n=1 Tax=Vibrio splendidus TaxID=29497 RepID=A0A2N7CH53_VIBSP|nr:hypothetical protein [Vibrio splendidus]PMF23403.1 hypothetical protein BCV19_04335 [Vibrio splendidus]